MWARKLLPVEQQNNWAEASDQQKEMQQWMHFEHSKRKRMDCSEHDQISTIRVNENIWYLQLIFVVMYEELKN